MKQNTSDMKDLFIEIKMTNNNNIKSVTEKLNLLGFDLDTNFMPKALKVTQKDAQKLFLVKGRIIQSLINQLKDCPDVVNYWELKPTIPFKQKPTYCD